MEPKQIMKDNPYQLYSSVLPVPYAWGWVRAGHLAYEKRRTKDGSRHGVHFVIVTNTGNLNVESLRYWGTKAQVDAFIQNLRRLLKSWDPEAVTLGTHLKRVY